MLITGAGRGLGHSLAKYCSATGWGVLATCRSPEAVARLRRLGRAVQVLHLELANLDSIAALADRLREDTVDVVFHAAGVYGPAQDDPEHLDGIAWSQVLRINTIAPVILSAKLLAPLRRSKNPRVVALSSRLGSNTENSAGGAYLYRSSKAALGAAMHGLAADLRGFGITVATLDPGPVRTGMNPSHAAQDPARAAQAVVALTSLLSIEQTGLFLDTAGRVVPW